MAGLERPRQVVAAVDHQAVAEAVDALVEQEVARVDGGVRAELAGLPNHGGLRQPREGELHDPVVVARVAGHRSVREGDAGVVLVVREPGVTDPV